MSHAFVFSFFDRCLKNRKPLLPLGKGGGQFSFLAACRQLMPRWASLKRSLLLLCVIGLLALSGCGSQVTLFTAMDEGDANEILSVLLQSKIDAQKSMNKNIASISVSSNDVEKALNVLRQHGLPHEQYQGMGQIFHKDGMISSPLEEQARYIYALSQELEKTLTKIDGVLVARVHVVLPIQDMGGSSKFPSSASVFIKYQANYNLELLKPQIQTLVANAIPELDEGHISIVLVAARPFGTFSGLSNPDATNNQLSAATSEQIAPESHSTRWGWIGGIMALMFVGTSLYFGWRRARAMGGTD